MLQQKNTGIDYFKVDALSNSGIKEIIKSPQHFKVWTETPKKTTDAMRIGTALHSYVLDEKRNFPIFSGETKTLKSKAGDAFLAYHPDGLTMDEWIQVRAMGEAILAEKKLAALISGSKREFEIYGQEMVKILREDGSEDWVKTPVKAKIDAMTSTAILDIKTTSECALLFPYQLRKYNYDVQSHWYPWMAETFHDGTPRDFYFIVVESMPPYGVLMFKAVDARASGKLKSEKGMSLYAQSRASNRWPSYNTNDILAI